MTEEQATDLAGMPLDDEDLALESDSPELVLPVWEPTGEPRVDAALDLLVQLDEDQVAEHAEVFAEVHRQLRQCLADLDAPAVS